MFWGPDVLGAGGLYRLAESSASRMASEMARRHGLIKKKKTKTPSAPPTAPAATQNKIRLRISFSPFLGTML